MTTKSTNEEAFKKAQQELVDEQVEEIKEIMKIILQKMQDYKDQKAEAEEALRLLKLDLEDLKDGEVEKIKKRHVTSKKAKEFSPIEIEKFLEKAKKRTWEFEKQLVPFNYKDNGMMATALGGIGMLNKVDFPNILSGTYIIEDRNGIIKEFFM